MPLKKNPYQSSLSKAVNSATPNKQLTAKLNRSDLEDRYFKIREQNVEMKTRINSLTHDVKMLKTKLIRQSEQSRREGNFNPDLEKIIKEQSCRIYILEKFNEALTKRMKKYEKRRRSAQRKRYSENLDDIILNCDVENENFGQTDDINLLDAEESTIWIHENGRKLMGTLMQIDNNEKIEIKNHSVEKIDKNIQVEDSFDKPRKKLKNSMVQTEFDKSDDSFEVNEILSQQLVEEQMKVIKLEKEANKSKLANKIFTELQEQIESLQEKMKNRENYSTTQNKDTDNKFKELQEAYNDSVLKIKALETLNEKYKFEILNLQQEIESMKLDKILKKKRIRNVATDSNDLKIHSRRNSPVDKKEKERITEEEKSDVIKNNELNTETLDLNIDKNDDEDVKTNFNEKNDYVNEMKSNSKIIKSKDCDEVEKSMEMTMDEDKNTKNNTAENENLKNSFDDATYSISPKNNSLRTEHEISEDDSISDGEIPNEQFCNVVNARGASAKRRNSLAGGNQSIPNGNDRELSAKAKSTLEALSLEIERCKSLINLKNTDFELNADLKDIQNIDYVQLNEDTSLSSSTPSFNVQSLEEKHSRKAQLMFQVKRIQLSDEALSDLFGHSSILTWQFSNQHIAHTPLTCQSNNMEVNFFSNIQIELDQTVVDYLKSDSIKVEIHKVKEDKSAVYAECFVELQNVLKFFNQRQKFEVDLRKGDSSTECGKMTCACQLQCDVNEVKKYLN